ncbi:MAG: NAD-dependent epimerase/dehydratase family protein [Thermodesulfobacteriota bacterium]|nr:NAD-dependent epimerase/dehydratase family protein [Thermodesulfobacteriota bacterium]
MRFKLGGFHLKALVTGGTGFIGSHLVEALLLRGAEVRCLVRKISDLKWLKNLPLELVKGDCSDKTSLREAVQSVDQVFHLAGITRALKEETYFEVNANGTENLIHACLENNPNLRKFIYLSSQAAAGPCLDGGKKKESDHCEPVSPYGRSKRRGEEFALEHAHEIPLVILRPSAVYGPRDRDVYVFFKILSKKIKPGFSRQEQHISLCYVEDIVQATLLAADIRAPGGEIFFLSDGHVYRMDEIGNLFEKAMGIRAYRIPIPELIIFGIASFSEFISRFSGKPALINKGKVEEMVQKNWVCDITKAKTLLGFEPRFSLAEGIKITYEWYRKENWL